MGEIKFRAWDKKENCWFDCWCIHCNGHYSENTVEQDARGLPHWKDIPENLIIMQFTGLCDKKGKEGCHKDICRIPRDHSWALFNQKKPMIATIEWDRGCFYLMCVLNGVERYCSIENLQYSEIIGNVFQNKDLLEEKK